MLTERDKKEYELALKQGKERYGSKCDHEKVKNGKCIKCFRKVISKL
jgi:hypothetical protein